MPTIQPAELWRESGRYDAYGKEMLRIKDRHEREMLYGPTNEEMITDIFRDGVKSYRELPQDPLSHPVEIPRRGAAALRRDARPRVPDEGRLFLRSRQGRRARSPTTRCSLAYMRTFARMGLKAIPMRGRNRADRRRSQPRIHHPGRDRRERGVLRRGVRRDRSAAAEYNIDSDATWHAFDELMTSLYAATDEKHDQAAFERRCPKASAARARHRSRAIFYFGTKYTEAMGVVVAGRGRRAGESRDGQLWHRRVAPGRRHHRGEPRRGGHHLAGSGGAVPGRPSSISSRATRRATRSARRHLTRSSGAHALYDDRDERAGVKFADADLMGHPWQIIIGPRGAANGHGGAQAPRERRARGALARGRARARCSG